MKTHGHSPKSGLSPEYRVWRSIKTRCFDVNSKDYRRYGACGITMCEEWKHSFSSFFEHVKTRPSLKHTIDRYPNPNGNYEPGNVRWATAKQQALNRKTSILITINGRTLCVTDWAKEAGIRKSSFLHRYRAGWKIEDLLLPRQSTRRHSEEYSPRPFEGLRRIDRHTATRDQKKPFVAGQRRG